MYIALNTEIFKIKNKEDTKIRGENFRILIEGFIKAINTGETIQEFIERIIEKIKIPVYLIKTIKNANDIELKCFLIISCLNKEKYLELTIEDSSERIWGKLIEIMK